MESRNSSAAAAVKEEISANGNSSCTTSRTPWGGLVTNPRGFVPRFRGSVEVLTDGHNRFVLKSQGAYKEPLRFDRLTGAKLLS